MLFPEPCDSSLSHGLSGFASTQDSGLLRCFAPY